MTTTEIQKRVDEIENSAWDCEVAHGSEDALRLDFIKYVASLNIPEVSEKAALVLKSEEIEFDRWCA